MCCGTAKWKREQVADHKFDFIDVRDFHETGCFANIRYMWVYILVLKSFLVYVADTYTAIAMLASNRWSGSIIANAGGSDVIKVPFSIGKWIFVGCIIMGFLLLLWEARKARTIIRSRDISYAYTNVMAHNYYCMKSYDHFCFFSEISNSKRRTDDLAFFVFFTFKGWKRLLLADSPRQVINALTLFAFLKANDFTTNISAYVEGSWVRAVILCTMSFSVIICAGSLVLLTIAGLIYVPLLCHIRGNLKEFCCHKVDKRIDELMRRKARTRQAQEAARMRKEAAGDFSHLKDKKGNYLGSPEAQPTLPNISLEDDEMYARSDFGYAPSKASEAGYYGHDNYPPYHQQRYELGESPMPQAPYAQSEMSLNSYDRQGYAGYDDPRSIPLSRAPTYRSDASSEHGQVWNLNGAPPLPVPADHYFAGQHTRSRTEEEELAYEPIRRTQLYHRAGGEPTHYGHDRLESQGSEAFDPYGGTRPESAFNVVDAYHR